MKKYAMTISALLLASPGLILIVLGYRSAILFIFSGLIISWGLIELYIALSKSFKGIAPSHPLIKVSRIYWVLFAIYSWFDFQFELTKVHLPFGILTILVLCYISALIIRICSVIYLGPSFSYDVKKPKAKTFTCSGPYRFIRHPSYLGICILGSLPGIILGSFVGFIGMMLTTMIVAILRTNFEDILLEDSFGESFKKYKIRTYSMIPFVY